MITSSYLVGKSDAELKAFHAGGIRGIRFSLADPSSRAVTPEMVEPLAKRVQDPATFLQSFAALCLPGDLAACAAWAVIGAHHTTRAPMVKLTSNSIVAEDPNVFEIADFI